MGWRNDQALVLRLGSIRRAHESVESVPMKYCARDADSVGFRVEISEKVSRTRACGGAKTCHDHGVEVAHELALTVVDDFLSAPIEGKKYLIGDNGGTYQPTARSTRRRTQSDTTRRTSIATTPASSRISNTFSRVNTLFPGAEDSHWNTNVRLRLIDSSRASRFPRTRAYAPAIARQSSPQPPPPPPPPIPHPLARANENHHPPLTPTPPSLAHALSKRSHRRLSRIRSHRRLIPAMTHSRYGASNSPIPPTTAPTRTPPPPTIVIAHDHGRRVAVAVAVALNRLIPAARRSADDSPVPPP